MAPPPPPALLRLSPTLRSTLLLLPWLILQGSPGGAFQSPGITISVSLPSHMPSSSFSPSLTCWLFLIYPSWPFQSALRCTLDSLLHLHSGAALQHKTSSVCPTSLLGWPRETWHLIGGARALDPTNASFSLSFSLLGTWHHDFPSCLIQSLRIHPGLSLFFIPYSQPICKTHWFSLHICVLLPQPQPTQPSCPLYPPHFCPHPWISSLTQHPPVVLKIPVLITTHKALQEPCNLAPAPLFGLCVPLPLWLLIIHWRLAHVICSTPGFIIILVDMDTHMDDPTMAFYSISWPIYFEGSFFPSSLRWSYLGYVHVLPVSSPEGIDLP